MNGDVKVKEKEIEELKELFSAIVSFVRELKNPITDLMKSIMTAVSGSELGADVAEFYKKLKESGMPDDIAINLTSNYLEARLTILRELGSIMSKFTSKEKWKPEEIKKIIEDVKEKAKGK